MKILYIVNAKIVVLTKWSWSLPNHVDYQAYNNHHVWTHNTISFKHM